MSRTDLPVIVGAVIYDPKVAVIWEIIKDYFDDCGTPMDYVFFSNYELQVRALLAGTVDVAWNSPLAWLDAQRADGACKAIAMRDTDQNRVTHFISRAQDGMQGLMDLAGRTLATGAVDSPQATLIPLGMLHRLGLEGDRDFQMTSHDIMVGKHGDHVGGELAALQSVVLGEADVCCVIDLNWQRWCADGTANPSHLGILATTRPYDHCVFTTGPDFSASRRDAWLETLYSMDYGNPAHRQMMDMEGLTAWLPGRTAGFEALTDAVEVLGYFATR